MEHRTVIDPNSYTIQKSQIDSSVNFVFQNENKKEGEYLEARFVQRVEDYYVVYLSSHYGCNKGCKFCHLTSTKQTTNRPASIKDLEIQSKVVQDYANTLNLSAKRVQINFMARGEALDNEYIDGNFLKTLISSYTKPARVNISTIMPKNLVNQDLVSTFREHSPILYYSLWSVNNNWRKEWMPSALPIEVAFRKLVEYQGATGTIVKIHGAFIEGQNDQDDQLHQMAEVLEEWSKHLLFQFNIVRYNPFSPDFGKESEKLEEIEQTLWEHRISSRTLKRVGFDVKCSCGMFVN